MMARAQDLSNAPYQSYTGDRLAGFNDFQSEAMNRIAGMQNPQEMDAASQGAYSAMQGFGGFQPGYQSVQMPQGLSSGFNLLQSPQQVNAQQISSPAAISAQTITAATANAPTIDPTGRFINRNEIERVDAGGINSLMQGPRDVNSFDFDNAAAQRYMSPYQQNVIDANKREALRDFNIQSQQRNSGLVSKGAFGGTRQAVIQAEAERNLADQLGDIQNRGMQDAFTNAQSQFNQDRGANLQSQMSNQGNTRAYDLASQGVGLQGSLANQQAGLQALLANQGVGSRGDLANQSTQMQANLANQGTQMQAQNWNAANNLAAQNLNNQFGLQTGIANQNANLQGQLANQQANMNQNQFGANMFQNWQNQLGDWNMQGQLANQQAGLAASGQRLNALQGQMGAAQGLAGIGQNQQNMFMDRANALFGMGNQQQQMMQRYLDMHYNDFVNARDFPRQNLSFYSGILRGVPTSPMQEVQQFNPAPNALGTLGGLGALGMGSMNYQGGGG